MRVLYIDFSGGSENLVLNPNRYGGGRIVPTYLREHLDDFYTAGMEGCFDGISSAEKKDKCIILSEQQVSQLRSGAALESVIKDSFDIVFTTNPGLVVNTTAKQLVWCVGYQETVHPDHKNIILHNPNNQHPILNSSPTIYNFRLGVNVPEFREYEKEDLIFQCTNHSNFLQSIAVAHFCSKYKIKCILAGPISEGYPLLQHVDSEYVKYIGQISEQQKIEISKKSKVHTLLFFGFINECPLSGKLALTYGNQIFTTPSGDMPNKVKEGVNGRFILKEEDFINGWNNRDCISQRSCYNSIKEFSIENMVNDIKRVFEVL